MDQAKIYLCKADSSMLGTLTGIQTQTCTLKRNATDLWELTFDVNRYIDADGSLVQSDYYDSVDEMMRLYLDSADIQAFFVIDSEPMIKGDGYQETKSVTAHSVECELCNLYLKNFKVNCGTPDSQEYLACETDQDQNTVYYNVNPYTKLPYEYISLVNYDDPQLSLLHLVLQGTGWTVKEGMDRDVYLDKNNYFRMAINTVKNPSDNSPKQITGHIKKKCTKDKTVYAVELQKWASSGIEFTTQNMADVTITAQSSNETVHIRHENDTTVTVPVILPSPIALIDSDNTFYDNMEGIKTVRWKSEDKNGITLTYKNLKPGTYQIISPYHLISDTPEEPNAYDYGVQIKAITVSEHIPSSDETAFHVFNAFDLLSNSDNEEIIGICQIKKSFESSDSIYSFLMKTVSPAASVIFEFDRKHKTVGMVKADKYGEDTGVFITMRNLMNSFEVTSTSNENIITKLIPTGANNLGIEQVNFGKDSILNLDYFMNTKNEYGDYKFVSEKLHDNYCKWKRFREEEPFSVSISSEESIQGTRREVYAELSKRYNQTLLDINELKNRVPNDGCIIDYTTYSQEELDLSLKAYRKALAMLITVYKNEYGVTELGTAPDYLPVPEDAVSIKETPYWYDFYAYEEIIIPKIEEALKQCTQSVNGEKKQIDSYLYEWSLYGLDELQAKKKAWSEAANLLFDECFIISNDTSSVTYRTPNILSDNEWNHLSDEEKNRFTGWNSLKPSEKARFTSYAAFRNNLKQYLDYMAPNKEYLKFMPEDQRYNFLTNTACKGIIRQCEDAIAERTKKITDIVEQEQQFFNEQRTQLANSVALNEHFTLDNNSELFTAKNIHIINGIIREQEFNNDNIIVTSLDDIVSTVDIQETLYQSAAAKLHELSQPQYSFHTELDNLYALDAFKAFQKPFDIGNFIRVGLETHEEISDNRFIKLRLISISHNPLQADENLSVEFSTMTKALNGINDLAFLLGNESGTSSGSSSGSGTSGGTYGNNDANVQISNNLLNALLCTETFGTAVNDVILDSMQAQNGKFATLFSKSGAFDALETGQIKVSGDCIVDAIKSKNYSVTQNNNGVTVETGSILDLSDGTFSFAGGNLKWDNSKLSINGNTTVTGSVITKSTFGGNIDANEFSAKKGTIAGWQFDTEKSDGFFVDDENTGIIGKKYLGKNGILMGDILNVSHDGFILKDYLYCTNINNYTLTPQNLASTYSDHPCRIYVYNYKDFDINQSFNIFFYYSTYLNVTIRETGGEHENDRFYIDNVVNQYRIKREKIKSIQNLSQEENSVLLQKVGNAILIDRIGYIDKEDLEFVDSNLEDACNDNMDGYIILEHELSDEIVPYGIYQENPLISDNYDNDVYTDSWRHEWNIEIGRPKLELIGLRCSSSFNDIHILSDITSVSGMALNSYSQKITINDTCMSNKGFSSKYMYDHIVVSGKPLYINSDGTIGLSGSSKRFKNSVSTNLTEIADPHGLYDIDIVQYKYNENYFSSPNDEGIRKYFIGFIAENVAEKFQDGATFDKDNLPDGWDIRYMFPAALKLIQEQHTEIEIIKKQLQELKETKHSK